MLLAAQFKAVAASSLMVSGRGRLLGYSLQENAGSPAVASTLFYDGTSSGGEILHRVGLAASGVVNPWFGPQGINFRTGLYVGAVTGSLTGVIYFVTEELLSPNMGVQSNSVDDKLFERMSVADFVRAVEYLNHAS